MSTGWSNEEPVALLGVRGASGVQSRQDGVCHNRNVYEKVASALADLGMNHTWQQYRTRVKNLAQRYRKVSSNRYFCKAVMPECSNYR